MPKRRKKMQPSLESGQAESDLTAQIKKITAGLYYMSETDAEVFPFIGKKAEAVNWREMLAQSKCPATSAIQEKTFADFFKPLTEIQDWFGDEESATAKKFKDLEILLENNLKHLKCFKIGKIQIDIYVVGLDATGILTGIKTKAVET